MCILRFCKHMNYNLLNQMIISRLTSDIVYQRCQNKILKEEHRMVSTKSDMDFWCDRMYLNIPYLSDLIDRCGNPENEYKKRMFWLMDSLLVQYPDMVHFFQKELLSIFLQIENSSALRSVTRIILCDAHPLLFEPYFLSKCADITMNKEVAVAVRCNTLELFSRAVVIEPDLSSELQWILERLSEETAPAIVSRVRKCQKTMNKHTFFCS